MKVKSEAAQLCPTLSDPMDCSPPGSSFHGIFQARVLEWGAIAFSTPIATMMQISRIKLWYQGTAREFQKNIYLCFTDYTKAFDCMDHNKLWKILKEMKIPWTVEPGRLLSMESQRVGHNRMTDHTETHTICDVDYC